MGAALLLRAMFIVVFDSTMMNHWRGDSQTTDQVEAA